MSSGITVAPRVNGDAVISSESRREAEFLEHLLQLRDAVFAGKHPRIKLPDSVLETVAPRPVPSSSTPSSARPAPNGLSNGAFSSPRIPSRPDSSSLPYQPTASALSQVQNAQRPFTAKSSSSSIDPVLLTKSEHLIRAEIQLKRLQIERTLKDQVDKKGLSRDKDFGLDAESRLDVDALLKQAHELVKPISGLQSPANGNSDASDSFDEDSYYSSKANSWSSEEAESSKNANHADTAQVATAQGTSFGNGARQTGAKPTVPLDAPNPAGFEPPTGDVQDDEEAYEPADDLEIYEPGPITRREEREESEYSPPPAADSANGIQHASVTGRSTLRAGQGRQNEAGNSNSMNGYGYNRRPSPTSPSVPVITNQIRTPVAPQPSRVSPLAFHKAPRAEEGRRNGIQDRDHAIPSPRAHDNSAGFGRADHTSPRHSRRQSPSGPAPNIQNPRKRRRAEERRSRAINKRVARSPEPVIKEEPISPPPFASYADAQPTKRRAPQQLSGDVEIISAREARRQPMAYYPDEPVSRMYRQYEEPASPTVVRVPSRVAQPRYVERDDLDLRRVASVQYARRPYSPVGVEPLALQASEPRHIRAPSQAVYREASVVRPSVASRIIRDRSRSPVHEYLPRAHSPMAPPPTLVEDQHGNWYYATPAEPRQSAAPPSRRIVVDPYYEREATVRAPTRIADDEDALQRMPPPPTRRYIEPPEAEVVEARVPRHREYSLRPAEPEHSRVREVVDRRPAVQYEEMGPPGQYVSRSFSMRPEIVRREVPADYTSARHESVQPGGYVRRSEVPASRYREVSIQHDPYEDRRYGYAAPQGRRYVEEQGLVEEPYVGEPRRVTYRY